MRSVLKQEFGCGQIKFELSMSHVSGAVEWTAGALERGRGSRLAFRVMSKSSVKFSLEVRCFQSGLMDVWSERLLSSPGIRIA